MRPLEHGRLGTQREDSTCEITLMTRPSEANLRENVWGRQMDAALEHAHGVAVIVLPAQSELWGWFAESSGDAARGALHESVQVDVRAPCR